MSEVSASPIEISLEDTYKTHFGTIEDLSTLWRLNEIVNKHIRRVEKNLGAKKKRVKEVEVAHAPRVAWNEQIHRVQTLSEKDGEVKVPYNHALKIGGALKADGKLSISKDGNTIPTDKDVEEAIRNYRENNDIKVAETKINKTAKNTVAETSDQAQTAKAKVEPKGKAKSKADEEELDMTTYSFIINGKSYERGDIDGKAYIWDAKGTYMGVYNEKTKKFDPTIPDPTIV